MEDPRKDLRQREEPEPVEPVNPPEPLVIPPEELRQRYEAMRREAEEELANRVFYHFVEQIYLRSFRQVLGFMRQHMGAYQEARQSTGFLAGGIRAVWWRKRFYSYFTWDTAADRDRYAQGRIHSDFVERVVRKVGAPGSGYSQWDSNQPPDWEDAKKQLERIHHYYVAPSQYS